MIAVTCWFSFHFSCHFLGRTFRPMAGWWSVGQLAPAWHSPLEGVGCISYSISAAATATATLPHCPFVKHFKNNVASQALVLLNLILPLARRMTGHKTNPDSYPRNEMMHPLRHTLWGVAFLLLVLLLVRQFVKWIPSHFGKLHKPEEVNSFR